MVRMRLTKSKRNSKRSHHSLADPACTTDGDIVYLRHRASRLTGMYRGRRVFDVKQESGAKQEKSAQDAGEKKTVEQVAAPE